jgi:hypothetical protein
VHAPGAAAVPAVPVAPVSYRYQQKWWHIPLLVVIGVSSTILSIVLQIWR